MDVYTYQRLHREVCKAANMLRRLGVRKGDRVVLYMPMVPQLAISMLACARIGAIHCVVFSGLSAESLKDRIVASGATVVISRKSAIKPLTCAPRSRAASSYAASRNARP